MSGAAAYGNHNIDLLKTDVGSGKELPKGADLKPGQHYINEQRWQVILTDARYLEGTWTLKPFDLPQEDQGQALKLFEVDLKIYDPDLTFHGLFWLSTGRPTLANALPDFDDWLFGLQPVPLKTIRRGIPVYIATEFTIKEPNDVCILNKILEDPSALETKKTVGKKLTYKLEKTSRNRLRKDGVPAMF